MSKGGAILDQVIAESAAPDNKCLLYKLANFKGGENIFEVLCEKIYGKSHKIIKLESTFYKIKQKIDPNCYVINFLIFFFIL